MDRDADKVSRRVADVLKDVASLEILQAPGLTFKIPDLFASIPRLTGAFTLCTCPASPVSTLTACSSSCFLQQLQQRLETCLGLSGKATDGCDIQH